MTGWNPEGTRYDLPDIVEQPDGRWIQPEDKSHIWWHQMTEKIAYFSGPRKGEQVWP